MPNKSMNFTKPKVKKTKPAPMGFTGPNKKARATRKQASQCR